MIPSIAQDADILVQCCFENYSKCEGDEHLSRVAEFTLADTKQTATIARECSVGHLMATHIRPKSDADMVIMEQEIREFYNGPLTIGTDMTSLTL